MSKTGTRLTTGFWGETGTINVAFLFVTGTLVGMVSAALGVGGEFLLVPVFSVIYGLPMYVLVAAAIPPGRAWGLFTASGGIMGTLVCSQNTTIPS